MYRLKRFIQHNFDLLYLLSYYIVGLTYLSSIFRAYFLVLRINCSTYLKFTYTDIHMRLFSLLPIQHAAIVVF